jgi:hypothetical protein
MWLLLNWRIWLLVGLLSLGPIGYLKGRHDGKRVVTLEWQASIANANTEARHLEQARQSAADAAYRLAATREAGIRVDADRARVAASGLRGDLQSTQRRSEESASAAAQRAIAYGELLVQSTEALRDVSERCDRHVSDLRKLLEAWPK